MKTNIKQISDGISEALVGAISIDKINKKLGNTIEKSAKKIAKELFKIQEGEVKKANKVAKRELLKDLMDTVVDSSKKPLVKALIKDPVTKSKNKVSKRKIT